MFSLGRILIDWTFFFIYYFLIIDDCSNFIFVREFKLWIIEYYYPLKIHVHIPQLIDDLLVVSMLLEQSKVSLTFLHIERMGEAISKCVSKSSSRFHFCDQFKKDPKGYYQSFLKRVQRPSFPLVSGDQWLGLWDRWFCFDKIIGNFCFTSVNLLTF
jgi:hypothetical protein